MHIPYVYLLFTAEFILIFLAICAFFVFYFYKKSKTLAFIESAADDDENKIDGDIEIDSAFDLSDNYTENLGQEIERNELKTNQQTQTFSDSDATNEAAENSVAPDDHQTKLLDIRQLFLNTEKAAAEQIADDKIFWDTIYSGIESICAQAITLTDDAGDKTVTQESATEETKVEGQNNKVDEEVNKLKDIITDQENTVSELRQTLKDAEDNQDTGGFEKIKNKMADFERQIGDSRTCMETLEAENIRLQNEMDELEKRYAELSSNQNAKSKNTAIEEQGADANENVASLKGSLEKQEQQIVSLNNTISELKLESEQAEKLKETIAQSTKSSEEMMGCVTILEEENETLKKTIADLENEGGETSIKNDTEISSDELVQLKTKLKNTQEDIIKKDVLNAKLQNELSSLEKEFNSMKGDLGGDSE